MSVNTIPGPDETASGVTDLTVRLKWGCRRRRLDGILVGTLDAGLTYGPTANLQLDAGVLLGVSEDADGATFFTGLTFRR